MLLHEKIIEDWKTALKNKDKKKDCLNQILSELKNKAIDLKVAGSEGRLLGDEMAIDALLKMAKQRRDTIDIYKEANRKDLADKEANELLIIESYLPKALSEDELKDLVKKAIKEADAKNIKDIGKVMPIAIKMAQGRAQGKDIQKIAQSLLV